MKKNIIVAAFAAASAILLAASCQKQGLLVEKNNGNAEGKTFTAVISQNLTKTTITSAYKVNWDQGDQIDINGAIFSATPDASDATKATFTKVIGSDPDGTFGYTAVYPASIMVGTQATLPATQTYAASKFNAPMCAMSSTESLEFKNFCGVLCFALKGTDKVKSIVVTANEQICGPFEFSTDATFGCFSGENVGKTVTLDCGEGVQLSSTDSTNFYIYLPPATYTTGMKITVTNTEGKTFKKTTTKSAEIARNKIYTFNWTATFLPAGALAGKFTVNAGGKQVYFSKGNLWYGKVGGAAAATWNFETNQYDTTPTSTSSWDSDHISHFFWSKTESVAYAESYSDGSAADTDVFFTNATEETARTDFTVSGVTGKYRTLSKDEWQYLFDSRTNANSKFGFATVGGVNGIIILPDTFTDPMKNNGSGAFVPKSSTGWDKNVYTTGGNWEAMETAGAVFLPAAGYRLGSDVGNVGDGGRYWSSSAYDSLLACRVFFYSSFVFPGNFDDRYYGYSVRLITECQ